jgi:hypothetical protein
MSATVPLLSILTLKNVVKADWPVSAGYSGVQISPLFYSLLKKIGEGGVFTILLFGGLVGRSFETKCKGWLH